MKKEITIYDIAKALNLSPSTVSRALNNNKVIHKNTRDKVVQFALANGYQANTFAASLRKNETHTLGVIVPKIDSKFISTCLAGAEKIAAEKGYHLIISQSFDEVAKEIAIAKTFFHKRVDGLMVSLTANTESMAHFTPFATKGIPMVFFDRTPDQTDAATYLIDNREAAYKATSHLMEQGCNCLVHLTINAKNRVYKERELGFKQALTEQNKANCGKSLFLEAIDMEAGKEAALKLAAMNPRPDGVFAANDQTAVGCIKALQALGIKVPDDIAVIGFNNDSVCEIINPALSTVNYPAFDLGALVANHLIEHILGNSNMNACNKTVLKSELIVRESSLKSKV